MTSSSKKLATSFGLPGTRVSTTPQPTSREPMILRSRTELIPIFFRPAYFEWAAVFLHPCASSPCLWADEPDEEVSYCPGLPECTARDNPDILRAVATEDLEGSFCPTIVVGPLRLNKAPEIENTNLPPITSGLAVCASV
ncbi:hypothetical protein INR49_013455 [Caranx melampygus]|nr:hypothetical protein INR49_013455 [Caranx melampygus]